MTVCIPNPAKILASGVVWVAARKYCLTRADVCGVLFLQESKVGQRQQGLQRQKMQSMAAYDID